MKAFKAPKVGEKVFVFSGRGNIKHEDAYRPVVVATRGRKWFATAEGERFSVETGAGQHDYSYPLAICAEQLQHISAVRLATVWLGAYGVELTSGVADDKVLEVYRALLAQASPGEARRCLRAFTGEKESEVRS